MCATSNIQARSRPRSYLLVWFCASIAGSQYSQADVSPRFVIIPKLSSTHFGNTATGISGDGTTLIGASGDVGFGGTIAMKWTESTGAMALAGGLSSASATSFDGSVIAVNVGSAGLPNTAAKRWTAAQGLIDLGSLETNPNDLGNAVSADGHFIVGVGQGSGCGTPCDVFRWTAETGMVNLGDMPGTFHKGAGRGVSADGAVLVGQGNINSLNVGGEAFRWTQPGGFTGLGDLPGGLFYSDALDVSYDGSIVVGESNAAAGRQAFRWTAETGMVALGALSPSIFRNSARAISGDGSTIVGWSDSTQTGKEPFVWTADTGLRNLTEILVDDLGLNLGSMVLREATDVSADGTTIVGWGEIGGVRRAWLAVVPEPTTLVLLLSFLFLINRRHRC